MSDHLDVGVNVDSKTLMVAVHGVEGSRRIDNSATSIKAWLAELPAGCRIGLEATNRYHEVLVQHAQHAGHTVFVLNPRDIKHYATGVAQRGKTDAGDAQVIARYVAKEGDELHEYVSRSPQQERLHVLLQQRQALIKARTQIQLSLDAKSTKTGRFSGIFRAIDEAIKAQDRAIQQTSSAGEHGDLYRQMLTIPGVGPTVAACLTHHITRWKLASADAWVACTGLDPRPNQSGARVGRCHLSKRGNAGLRQTLYMAAMGLTRAKGGRPLYEALQARGHSSTAAFNILARKLDRISWGVFKSGRDFNPALMGIGDIRFGSA
ncbi:IS110 family transposase [Stenotrophomonas sp. SORGH_AS_0321]|uniref:IS110 family transposase n=1 Tax=Stenotrophomonas sp. SORGH_AS_0321 TaxID=3041787 RepID=UPI00285C6954|nr:IS110 family transposase [Stenotrophomonas sp. SORGH_AS_0321]MDR6094035.1 transposase [Stenotrophomonas sp. SORGH_AS_0321]